MNHIVPPYRFFEFSDAGSNPEGSYRWMATAEFHGLDWWGLCKGTPVSNWDPESGAIVHCETPGPPEDMPWVGLSPPIVSDRLRRLLEKHEPNCAQFLRVQMKHEGRLLALPPYWAANCLRVEDCIDWDRSLYKDDPLTPGKFVFRMEVIDPARISCRLLRIQHYITGVLIRADLRKIIEDHRITGCQFYDVWHSGDNLPQFEFDPKAFHCFSDRFADEPNPRVRIDRAHEFMKTVYMRNAAHCRDSLPRLVLRDLILGLGNQIGVDWKGEGGERLCKLFLDAEPQTTGTYKIYIEIEGERSGAVFHFCVEDTNTISFGFWGRPSFIVLAQEACRQAHRNRKAGERN